MDKILNVPERLVPLANSMIELYVLDRLSDKLDIGVYSVKMSLAIIDEIVTGVLAIYDGDELVDDFITISKELMPGEVSKSDLADIASFTSVCLN